jgi:hypothetical protein
MAAGVHVWLRAACEFADDGSDGWAVTELEWVTCCACNGSGQIVCGVAASDPANGWRTSNTRHECIPCRGSGRLRQRYPVAA